MARDVERPRSWRMEVKMEKHWRKRRVKVEKRRERRRRWVW